MVDKPQYFLILKNGTASLDFFKSADARSKGNEAILWSRIKDKPDHIIKNASLVVNILLENPLAVFFAQELVINDRFKEYPCQIVCTSKALFSVNINLQI